MIEGRIVVVYGEGQPVGIGAGGCSISHGNEERISLADAGRTVGGEIDGFPGGIFEMQQHRYLARIVGGGDGRRGMGEGKHGGHEQKRHHGADEGARA